MSIDYILRYCKHHKIHVLSITDHDVMFSPSQAEAYSNNHTTIIPAIEYQTAAGDIIGLFVEHQIYSKKLSEVLASIHSQQGLAFLPHPTKTHSLKSIPPNQIDLGEAFNARCSFLENKSAAKWCLKNAKPMIAGSDAHFPWELEDAITHFEVDETLDWRNLDHLKQILLYAPRHFETSYTPLWSIKLSQAVKGLKHHRPRHFIFSILNAFKCWLTWKFRSTRGK